MRKYLWLIFRIGPFLLFNYFWIFKYSRHPEKYSNEERFTRLKKFVSKANKAFRTDIIIKGEENMPVDDASFITPNHISFFDPIILAVVMKRPFACVAKKEVLKYPYVGRIQKIYGGLFLDRSDLRQELKVMREVRESLKNNEKDWIVFPEGKRNKDMGTVSVAEFKHGAFKMVLEVGHTIYPVAIYGTHRVLSTKHHLKRYPVHISFLKPISKDVYQGMNSTQISKVVEDLVRDEYIKLKEINDNLVKKK